jgi:peptidoglycan/xylan/chitin deacetylase (PgdA/CDA1 family)
LVQALSDGDPPKRSVVITFDDGYADSLRRAKPLLERYDTPATVFVVTGAFGQGREFWWDELEQLILQPSTLPDEFQLTVNGYTHSWELGEAARYTKKDALAHRHWRAWDAPPSRRHGLYRSLWEMLRAMPQSERQRVLDALREWASSEPVCRLTRRLLDPPEVLSLAQDGLIEIGAHTVTHPALSVLPVAMQRAEVEQGKSRLEEILGQPVSTFSYPYGSRSDYTAETVGLVREAGYTGACLCCPGVVQPSTERFQLPRIHVYDCDGEAFAKSLWRWFYG